MTKTRPLFELGRVMATPGAIEMLERQPGGNPAGFLLARHVTGDWGKLSPGDKKANDQALKDGTRLLSAYDLLGGERIWIITEADRAVTTILLPEEY